jgi:hypothetical protein
VGFSYNANDLVTQQTVGGKVVATPTYDSLGRMTGLLHDLVTA